MTQPETAEQFGEAMAKLEAWREVDPGVRYYCVWRPQGEQCWLVDVALGIPYRRKLFDGSSATLSEAVDAVLAKHAASGGTG